LKFSGLFLAMKRSWARHLLL